MLFTMRQSWWVAYRDMEFLLAYAQFHFTQIASCVPVVEKVIMKMQKKSQWHTRGLAAQFIAFLHALEYQHIDYMLGWCLLRCFYPRVRIFRKRFWKRCEVLFQKMFALIRKQHIILWKLVRKFFCKTISDVPESISSIQSHEPFESESSEILWRRVRVESWLGRVESQEWSSHFESLVYKLESMSSYTNFKRFLYIFGYRSTSGP